MYPKKKPKNGKKNVIINYYYLRLKDNNIYKSRLIGRGQSSRESTRQLHASKINLHIAANRVAFGL